MPAIASTTAAKTAATDARLLPEIVGAIGSFLGPPSLYSCIQVCSRWYHVLLPLLWKFIDDSLYSWPAILNQEQHDTDHPVSSNIESWLRAVYTKHGHLIRHLTIHWSPTLDAASLSNTCTRLQSFIIRNVHVTLSPTDEAHQKQTMAWPAADQERVREERTDCLLDEFLLTPEFKEVLRPNNVWWTTGKKHGQDWMTGQRFWMLVLQNPGLCTLGLGRCLDYLCKISTTDFLNSTLAGLHCLTSLENNIHSEHLEHILARHPTLTSLRTSAAFNSTTLSTSFPGMRSLTVGSGLKSRDFFLMLHHLPNLYDLVCGTLGLFDGVFCQDADKILEGRPSKLQRLSFQNALRTDTPIANYVLPWIPHVKEITIRKRVWTAIANALVLRCQELEVFRQQDDTEPIDCFQSPLEQRNFLLVILQGCPKLRIFDAIHHRIDAKQLTEKPFACEGLETFRCQVVGLERQSKDVSSMFGRITELSAAGRDTIGVAATIQKMAERLQEQQVKIFEQFSRLTQLITLDLGYAWRNPSALPEGTHYTYKGADGKYYVRYGDPIRGTLELTLETGFDRLWTLTRLEVFGFEGVDFRLGKPELEWMAANWPRLRVLRGLQKDDHLPQIEPDLNKVELRRHMRVLRPEVKHQGLALKMAR